MPRVIVPKGSKMGRFGKTKASKNATTVMRKHKSTPSPCSLPPKQQEASKSTEAKEKEKEDSYIGGFILEGAESANPPGEKATSTLPPLLACHRSLILDTRCCVVEGEEPVGDITDLLKLFVETTRRRGVHPLLLTTMVVDPSQKSAVTLSTTSGRTRKVSYVSGIGIRTLKSSTTADLSSIGEPIPVKFSKVKNDDGSQCSIPNNMTAEITWELFADMIVAQAEAATETPFDISLLGTDISLFSDSSIGDHVIGFEKFMKKVSPLFVQEKLCSVDIIVVKTGLVREVETNTGGGANETRPPTDEREEYSNMDACMATLREKMEELEYPERGTPTHMSLQSMENSVLAFKQMSRDWVREAIGPSRKVSLDLPTTKDGSQCAVGFDASFHIFPHSMSCAGETGIFRRQIDQLSSTRLEVHQSIALTAVDASLLYGVPIRLEAHLESDLDRFRENKGLVRLLLERLQSREQALLLRAATGEKETTATPVLYLFMVQEQASSSAAPTSAVLFHYANADDLLSEAAPSGLSHEELDVSYMEYIEESLGGLAGWEVFNPLTDIASSKVADDSAKLNKGPSFDSVADFPPVDKDVEMEEVPIADDDNDDSMDVSLEENDPTNANFIVEDNDM